MANINIYGELYNNTPNGYVAQTSQIKDTELGKLQSELNKEFIYSSKNTSYLVCSTPENEPIKEVPLPGYTISSNTRLLIKMEHRNISANVVKLGLGATEAKNLLYNGIPVSPSNTWYSGEVIEVYYDSSIDKFCSFPSGLCSRFSTGEVLHNVGINDNLAPDSDKLLTCRSIYGTVGDGLWKMAATESIGSIVPAYKSIPVNLYAGVTYTLTASYDKISQVTFQPYRKSGGTQTIINLPSDVEVEFTPVVNLDSAELVVGQVTDPNAIITLRINVSTVISTLAKQVAELRDAVDILSDQVFPLTVTLENDINENIIEYTGTPETINPVSANITWSTLKFGNPVIPQFVILKRNGSEICRWTDLETNTDTFLDENILTFGRVNYNVTAVAEGNKKTATTYFNIVLPCYAGFYIDEVDLVNMKDSLTKKLVDSNHANELDGMYVNNSNNNYLTFCLPNGVYLEYVSSTGFEIPMQRQIEQDTSIIINNEEMHYTIYRSASKIRVTTVNLSCILSFDR